MEAKGDKVQKADVVLYWIYRCVTKAREELKKMPEPRNNAVN